MFSLSSIRPWKRHGSCVSFRNHGLFGSNGTSGVGYGFDDDGGPCPEGGDVGGHLW